ncbi:alpha/beta hydrolase [Vibrio variabilis]|uniref:alpha/beta hydrolase n=1 Tax=Vibrio variabilis TaxID=990271 RepID=UPI000DD6C33B|nr:alpha/beta hydrolase [Vibrio variabilis]
MKKTLIIMLLFLLPVSLANANYTVRKDIVFKQVGDKTLALDLYLPTVTKTQPAPLLIWVHGGAWKRGSKDAIPTKNPRLLNSFLERGYALASVDYRLSGEATFPAPVADINDALNYLYEKAAQYQVDANKVVLMGRSAGGHLAGLVGALNTHKEVGFISSPNYQVAAVVSFFGPTDLLALGNKGNKKASAKSSVSRFLGGIPSDIPDVAIEASTTTYIGADSPAYILLHGDEDKRVPHSQSELLKAKLDEFGVENALYIEKGVGHSADVFDSPKYVPTVVSFVGKYL